MKSFLNFQVSNLRAFVFIGLLILWPFDYSEAQTFARMQFGSKEAKSALSSSKDLPGDGVLSPEPRYCQLDYFIAHELSEAELGISSSTDLIQMRWNNHLHGFKVGDVTVIGVSVGESNPRELMELAKVHSKSESISESRFCTWYLNVPKVAKYQNDPKVADWSKADRQDLWGAGAQEMFMNLPIAANPKKLKYRKAATLTEDIDQLIRHFHERTDAAFVGSQTTVSFCAEKFKYLALGCNGMNHRGPVVFGMLLAFSGCHPESAFQVIQHFWPTEFDKANPNLKAGVMNGRGEVDHPTYSVNCPRSAHFEEMSLKNSSSQSIASDIEGQLKEELFTPVNEFRENLARREILGSAFEFGRSHPRESSMLKAQFETGITSISK